MKTEHDLQRHLSWAQCTACGETFSTDGQFDDHRYGGECVDPSVLGLVEVDGLWGTPEGHKNRARLGAQIAVLGVRGRAVAEREAGGGEA